MSCLLCKGTGLIAPLPFLRDWERIPWDDFLAGLQAELTKGFLSPTCEAVCMDRIRPVACPAGCLYSPIAEVPGDDVQDL